MAGSFLLGGPQSTVRKACSHIDFYSIPKDFSARREPESRDPARAPRVGHSGAAREYAVVDEGVGGVFAEDHVVEDSDPEEFAGLAESRG